MQYRPKQGRGPTAHRAKPVEGPMTKGQRVGTAQMGNSKGLSDGLCYSDVTPSCASTPFMPCDRCLGTALSTPLDNCITTENEHVTAFSRPSGPSAWGGLAQEGRGRVRPGARPPPPPSPPSWEFGPENSVYNESEGKPSFSPHRPPSFPGPAARRSTQCSCGRRSSSRPSPRRRPRRWRPQGPLAGGGKV